MLDGSTAACSATALCGACGPSVTLRALRAPTCARSAAAQPGPLVCCTAFEDERCVPHCMRAPLTRARRSLSLSLSLSFPSLSFNCSLARSPAAPPWRTTPAWPPPAPPAPCTCGAWSWRRRAARAAAAAAGRGAAGPTAWGSTTTPATATTVRTRRFAGRLALAVRALWSGAGGDHGVCLPGHRKNLSACARRGSQSSSQSRPVQSIGARGERNSLPWASMPPGRSQGWWASGSWRLTRAPCWPSRPGAPTRSCTSPSRAASTRGTCASSRRVARVSLGLPRTSSRRVARVSLGLIFSQVSLAAQGLRRRAGVPLACERARGCS